MNCSRAERPASCVRIAKSDDQGEIARVWVYFIRNDLHDRPYALIEDLFVEPRARGRRLADEIMREAHDAARDNDCYKVVAASRHDRPWVHGIYLRLGYADHGKEFRLDL